MHWLSVYTVITLFFPILHASIRATSSAACAEKCEGKEFDFKTLSDDTTAYPLTFVPSRFFLHEPSTNITISAVLSGTSVNRANVSVLQSISVQDSIKM